MRNQFSGMPRLFLLLSLALAGLMVLQVLLLKYAWDLKEQSFVRGVQSALAATVVALESGELEGQANEYFFSLSDSAGSSTFTVAPPAPDLVTGLRTKSMRRELRRGRADSLVVVVDTEAELPHRLDSFRTERSVVLRHVVGEWINRPPRPIAERLDLARVGELLRGELERVGISAEPRFGVIEPADHEVFELAAGPDRGRHASGHRSEARTDQVVMASDNVTGAELLASPYRHQLFPLDPFASPYDLALAFPATRLYLLRQIGPLWLASVLFITVIVASFAQAWRTNREQRRFAGQLTDFINNMTHEFKTPISTVALAGEALARPDVRAQPEVHERYLGMIRDENERMHRQVEKILQMARLESGDLQLRPEVIDLHGLLRDVAGSFALQIEGRGGQLACELAAARHLVVGDRVHLESIFSNLVDNAVKYSPQAPLVRVATCEAGNEIEVRVSDRGPGINREDQRRVFEKYYRCPTGNRHDVKGHGLGLCFVRSLAAAHGGSVELHSVPGSGTTVTVRLPRRDAAAPGAP